MVHTSGPVSDVCVMITQLTVTQLQDSVGFVNTTLMAVTVNGVLEVTMAMLPRVHQTTVGHAHVLLQNHPINSVPPVRLIVVMVRLPVPLVPPDTRDAGVKDVLRDIQEIHWS